MICYYYNLDATPAKQDVLRRRIKKANLLGSGEKQISRVSISNDSLIPKNKPASSMVDNSQFNSKKSKTKSNDNFQTPEVHFHISAITHSKNGKIGICLTVIGIIISIIALFNL